MKKTFLFTLFFILICASGLSQENYYGVGNQFIVPMGDAAKSEFDLGIMFKGSYLRSVNNDSFYLGASAGYGWYMFKAEDLDFFTIPVSAKVILPLSSSLLAIADGGYAFATENYENSVFLNPGLAYQFNSGAMAEVNYQMYLNSNNSMNALAIGGTYYFNF